MMKMEFTVSLNECYRAHDAINDCPMLSSQLHETYSDTWESDELDDDEYENLESDLEEQMSLFGITEYDIIAKRVGDLDSGFASWQDYNNYMYGN